MVSECEKSVEELKEDCHRLKQQLSTACLGPSMMIDGGEVDLGDQIGSGGFSVVYRGVWQGAPVAVKQWFDASASSEQRTAVREEIMTLAGLRHPNILQFCGADTGMANTMMVTELLPFNLSDVLYKMTSVDLMSGKAVEIALDVARAFVYLHSRKPRVIHRDLKPHNILLDRAWKVKVCDFGLASSPRPEAGTPNYMAPELFTPPSSYTEKVDIYAFGILLNELYTRRPPFNGKSPADIKEAVLNGQRPETTLTTPDAVKKLVLECWHTDPQQRPVFSSILDSLSNLKHKQ